MNARSAFLAFSATLSLCMQPCPGSSAAAPAAAAATSAEVMKLDWEALLPAEERENYHPAPPPPVHDYLGEGSLAALQTGSSEVNRALDGKRVRIPGFVVPLERSADGLISTFFLVPYFGACIHVPPPPPNQIVYVRMREGAGLRSIDDAVWVIGTLHARSRRSELGAAAYTLDGEKLEPYQYTTR
jgi:uncharacterized protein